LSTVRIVKDPVALGMQIEDAGPNPEVVLEATYGWYWAVDALQAAGADVHLAHPLGVKGFRYRRVKNDVRDAGDLADRDPLWARQHRTAATPRRERAARTSGRTAGPDGATSRYPQLRNTLQYNRICALTDMGQFSAVGKLAAASPDANRSLLSEVTVSRMAMSPSNGPT
jgi:transposase